MAARVQAFQLATPAPSLNQGQGGPLRPRNRVPACAYQNAQAPAPLSH